MGNIVVSEALRQIAVKQGSSSKPVVNTCVASQGAAWAESFDGTGGGASEMRQWDEYLQIKNRTSAALFSGLESASSKLVNFYNPSDYALANRVDC